MPAWRLPGIYFVNMLYIDKQDLLNGRFGRGYRKLYEVNKVLIG